jgi:hypothetical protein
MAGLYDHAFPRAVATMLAKVQVTTALIGAVPDRIAVRLIGDRDRLAGASPAMTAC